MILYFSGTGNTALASKLLAEALGESGPVAIDTDMLLHPEAHTIATQDDRIIWAFPTYSWGIPPVVSNFIEKVQIDGNVKKASHYMLTTCGDDMGYVDRQWRKLMRKRGLKAVSAFAVEMPNTYVCMKGFDVDSAQVEEKKLKEVPETVLRIADAIRNNGGDILVRKSFSRVKTYIIYPWFKRFAMSPKPFHSTSDCVSCGRCSASCPMANIRMDNRHPVWSDRCAMCLRCYHICPVHAVAYGKETLSKGQYKTQLDR